MTDKRFAAAQKGVPYDATILSPLVSPAKRSARGAMAAAPARRTKAPSAKLQAADAVPAAPFLAPGSLSNAERLRILKGFEAVIEGVYTHLPLKRARYGFDPVQRLRILRTQITLFDDDTFHKELAAILTEMRDAHTRYSGPISLAHKVAALPFFVEMIGSTASPTYIVTKVAPGLDPQFKPGVVLEYWNGVPIDRAVMRHSDEEIGGRPDSQRAWSVQSLTMRSLQYGPAPDELWVIVGYRTTDASGAPTGAARELRVPWQILDPSQIDTMFSEGPVAQRAKLRRTLAVNPAAAAVRQAKMLLFAPQSLVGEQAPAPLEGKATQGLTSTPIPTDITNTLRVQTLEVEGGPPIGYLRIWGFDTPPGQFIEELLKVIPKLPPAGLIIDVRANPGGYILAAELALQLFTPKRIEPTRFSVLATPFTRDMASLPSMGGELDPWRESLIAAVRNGELYSQPIPITSPADCNAIGQLYPGPVVLVGDSTTYSAGDLFAAGFVDNDMGPFVCVGEATGAGGANVWKYTDLRSVLADSGLALPSLTAGIGLTISFRRATRAGPSEGLPIEDVGIAGTPYAMTRADLLSGNVDLLKHLVALLRQQKASNLTSDVDRPGKKVTFTAQGLDRVDLYLDGHPASSTSVTDGKTVVVSFTASSKLVEAVGFKSEVVRQRRRIALR
ncbi:MAG: S41 family peptidase [Proteobacteria bacterium]|nr:S41 family peptidase [Pseudomonadota bacterium]